jgi:Xaa-Pro dipeptidase
MFEARMDELRRRMGEADIDVALITDDDNVYYLTGYYDYLHMEFGRPTILVVPRDGKSLLITPTIDVVVARKSARVDRVAAWNDGAGNEWREELPAAIKGAARVAIEPNHMPPVVRAYVDEMVDKHGLASITPVLADMRMIKTTQERAMQARLPAP